MRCPNIIAFSLSVSGAAMAAALLAAPAQAQQSPATNDAQNATAETEPSVGAAAGDIVVTASKRVASTVQDTPISVQALSGDDLKARGAVDFADFYRSVPGLSVQDEGPGDKRYVIRGINSNGAGTVGLYLDETVITGENAQDGSGQAPDIKLFDIDRVEVLRGPQGTTFGASSMAGTIRYITAKPKLDRWTGYVQSGLRATRGADLGLQTDGAINIPVIAGVLAVRASGFYADLPGYIDNRFQEGANAEKSKAGRLQARLQITPDLTLDGMAMYQKVHQDAKNFYNRVDFAGAPLTGYRYQQADVARAPYDDESEIYNATLTYAQPFGTVTATGSRFVRDTDFNRDASLAAQAFFDLPYDGAGRSLLRQVKHRRVDSAELRFASDFGGPFQLLFGGFYQNENRNYRSYWPTVNAQGVIDASTRLLLDRTVGTDIKEKALFGEASYAFVPNLTLTVGARLFDFNLEQRSVAIVSAGGGTGAGPGPLLKASDSGLIGRFNLAWKVNEQVNAYVQVAQGYRSGGTNDQTAAELANVSIPAGYGSDSLWNYELGVKTALLDRKLYLNGAVYYIDWSNIQVTDQASAGTVSFPFTGNGGKASVKGAELTLDARPVAGLQLNLGLNYSLAELSEDNPVPATGRKGDRVPYVPEWTGSAGFSYTAPIGDAGLEGTIGADASYQGSMATKFNSAIANYRALDSYWLVGLRAGVSRGPWALNLNMTNLFDDNTPINYNEIVPGVYPDGFYISRPRTVTLAGTVRF